MVGDLQGTKVNKCIQGREEFDAKLFKNIFIGLYLSTL